MYLLSKYLPFSRIDPMSQGNHESSTIKILGDRYQIQQTLEKQGGRETFLATDLSTQTSVVIKRLTFGCNLNWDSVKLFELEAQTLSSLSHPAIPQYLDFFTIEEPGRKGFALVQSYIPGKSLQEYLAQGILFSEQEIKTIVKAILDILEYLHQRKPLVIHRDIKPSNILIVKESDNSIGKVYLVDFGSVQTLAILEGKTVTVVGTYGYMPPEQFGGRVTSASDLYSLGATAIALATGKHPAELPQKDLKIEFESEVRLTPNLIHWLRLMTEPSLEKRFSSVSEAREALEKPWLINSDSSIVSSRKLFWHSVWSSTLSLGICGIAFVYQQFLEMWSYGKFPDPNLGYFREFIIALIWWCVGSLIGLVNGILIGSLSYFRFFPLTDAKGYRQTVIRLSSIFGIILGAILGLGWHFQVIGADIYLIPASLTSAIIFGLGTGVASMEIAKWYKNQSLSLSNYEGSQ